MIHTATRHAEHLTIDATRILEYMERTDRRIVVMIDHNGVTGGPGAFVGYEGTATPFPPHERSAVTELIRRERIAYDGQAERAVYYRARRYESPEPPKWNRAVGQNEMVLEDGQSVANPASTKRRIYGPCRIEYRVFEDGGIDAHVIEGG